MEIKTNVVTKVAVDIELPVFWKQVENTQKKYLAVLNEQTCIWLYVSSDGKYTNISHVEPSIKDSEIVTANSNLDGSWQKVSEEEFLDVHKIVLQSLSLEPHLVENPDDIGDIISPTLERNMS